MSVILEVKNITKKFHDPSFETEALKDISFSVSDGEFISIVGPSGCGKSTLLSIICNLIAPSSGEVFLKGQPVANNAKLLGYMLQKDHLFEWRTILGNVCLGLEIQDQMTEEKKRYVEKLLEKYGLGEFKNHYPSQLSGGMRQRVALIRTLALDPQVLLLDEPFSALDYQTRLYVSDEIYSIIRKEKKTAILVTHDISEAVSFSDRIVVLTNRPATVSSIHDVHLTLDYKTPMKAREAPEFRFYFNQIWKELDING